jgi:hypothetical protein
MQWNTILGRPCVEDRVCGLSGRSAPNGERWDEYEGDWAKDDAL